MTSSFCINSVLSLKLSWALPQWVDRWGLEHLQLPSPVASLPNINLSAICVILHDIPFHASSSSSSSPTWVKQHQPCWRRTGTAASRAASLCQAAETVMGSLHVWTSWLGRDQMPEREGHSFQVSRILDSLCKWSDGCKFGISISFLKRQSLTWIQDQYSIYSMNRFKCSNSSRLFIFSTAWKSITQFQLAAGSGLSH